MNQTRQAIAKAELLLMRATNEADLDFVLKTEEADDNRAFVGHWSREGHRAALSDPDLRHLVLEDGEGQLVGYVICTGLTDENGSINLKRIAIAQKGRGYGHVALRLLQRLAFEEWQAHRFWLDVKDFNARARHLYEAEGFVFEGLLRDVIKTADGYESLVIMSILASEYEARKSV